MAKPPYHRIFLNEGSNTYLLCRLWQQKSDESKATINLSTLTFDDVATPRDPNDQYAGITVLSATPRYL